MKSLTWLAFLIAATAVSGCSKIPTPSEFYSGVDLQAIVQQCAPHDLKWGGHGSGSSEGGSPLTYHRNKRWDFQVEQDSLDTFVNALKTEIQKAVEDYGGRVTSSVNLRKNELPKALARRGIKRTAEDGKENDMVGLTGFQVNYEVGRMLGEILVTVSRNDEVSETNPYPLNLSVDIFEPTSAGHQPVVQPEPNTES